MPSIKEIMTPNPKVCAADATLQEVARLMIDEDTGFIPVIRKGRICGVITDRDIVVRATAQGVDPTQARAGDFCSIELEWVSQDTSVDDAIELMEARKIRRLLVCDGGCPIGVVSLGDLAECRPDDADAVLVEVSKSEKTLAHGRAP
jgi:CBS domain-containing protein